MSNPTTRCSHETGGHSYAPATFHDKDAVCDRCGHAFGTEPCGHRHGRYGCTTTRCLYGVRGEPTDTVAIYRYEVPVVDRWFTHSLTGRIIHVDLRRPMIVEFWAIAGDIPEYQAQFRVYGTGHRVPGTADYVGTVLDGNFVWHLFKQIPRIITSIEPGPGIREVGRDG